MQPILLIIFTVVVAEVGCLLRSTALVMKYGSFNVFVGTVVGSAIAAIIGIYLGSVLKQYISENTVTYMAGFTLVLLGVWILFDTHHH